MKKNISGERYIAGVNKPFTASEKMNNFVVVVSKPVNQFVLNGGGGETLLFTCDLYLSQHKAATYYKLKYLQQSEGSVPPQEFIITNGAQGFLNSQLRFSEGAA